MTIDPRDMSVKEWCDYMVLELDVFGAAPILLDPDKWKDWARVVIEFPGVSKFGPPRPESFDDWRQWAIRFNQAVTL